MYSATFCAALLPCRAIKPLIGSALQARDYRSKSRVVGVALSPRVDIHIMCVLFIYIN